MPQVRSLPQAVQGRTAGWAVSTNAGQCPLGHAASGINTNCFQRRLFPGQVPAGAQELHRECLSLSFIAGLAQVVEDAAGDDLTQGLT